MSLSDLASLGTLVSGVAVLISLIFLYLQLRQVNRQMQRAEKIQQANVRQQRASRNVATNMGLATEPSLVGALHKIQTGARDISSEQIRQCLYYAFAMFSGFEDLFFQHRDGLMTDRDFGSVKNALGRILRLPGYRLLWKHLRPTHGAEFTDFMDALLARTPVASPILDPAEWLRDWDEEVALINAGLTRRDEPNAALAQV
jgi:hypothetical protein